MTFEDLMFTAHPIGCGIQATIELPNKWGLSVVTGNPHFYCDDNTYEVAILYDGILTYTSGLTDDVLSYQTKEDINNILAELEKYD